MDAQSATYTRQDTMKCITSSRRSEHMAVIQDDWKPLQPTDISVSAQMFHLHVSFSGCAESFTFSLLIFIKI